jgi:hypothetical protein
MSPEPNGYKASAAQIGVDRALRGRLYGRQNQLSPVAKVIYVIAGLEVPIAPSAPPQGRRKPHWISPAKRKALADYPLGKISPELIAKLREKGVETRADFIDTLKKRGFKAGAAYIGAGKVLKGKLFGIKNRLSPVAKAAYEIAGLELPASPNIVPTQKLAKTVRGRQSKDLTAYPLNDNQPELVNGLIGAGIGTRADMVRGFIKRGFAKKAATNGADKVLRNKLYDGRSNRLIPAAKTAVYRPFGVRRQDEENLDIFGFLQTEPVWKEKLTAGITLGSLLQDLHRRDQSAARALVNACSAIPAFLKSYPDAAQASDLERFQAVLAKQPYSLAVNKELKAKTGFIREFTETYNPSTYRHFVRSSHGVPSGPPV